MTRATSKLLLPIYCVATADEKKQIFHECKPFPHSFFNSAPSLLDFAPNIAWFFGNLFNGVYFILNTVLITVCEVISSIFSCLNYAIKMVEYLCCGVKAILQLNYNIVSFIFEWMAKTACFLTDSVRWFAKAIIYGVVSVFQCVLTLIRPLARCKGSQKRNRCFGLSVIFGMEICLENSRPANLQNMQIWRC